MAEDDKGPRESNFAIDLDHASMLALPVVMVAALVKLGIGAVLCVGDLEIRALEGKSLRCRQTQDGFVITVEGVAEALARAAVDPDKYVVHDYTKEPEAPGSWTKH